MEFFLMLIRLIPSIIELVKQLEVLIPQPGQGALKLNMVLDTVNAAAQASPPIIAAIGGKDLSGAITGIVNVAVKTLNAAGVFAKPADKSGPGTLDVSL